MVDEGVNEGSGAYTGQWTANSANNNQILIGGIIERHGHGTFIFLDGSIYEGYWLND